MPSFWIFRQSDHKASGLFDLLNNGGQHGGFFCNGIVSANFPEKSDDGVQVVFVIQVYSNICIAVHTLHDNYMWQNSLCIYHKGSCTK